MIALEKKNVRMFYVLCVCFRTQCLDSLLSVLVKEMGPERKNMEAVQVAERFVRSVVRVFTICHTESVCVPSGSLVATTSSSARRKRCESRPSPLPNLGEISLSHFP